MSVTMHVVPTCLAAFSMHRLPEAAVPVLKFFNQTDFKIEDRYEMAVCKVQVKPLIGSQQDCQTHR
jgi:hypothetical protein